MSRKIKIKRKTGYDCSIGLALRKTLRKASYKAVGGYGKELGQKFEGSEANKTNE